MYRIMLESGEETVLENIEDLLYSIGSGVVTSSAKIYHANAQKWLPITVHPDYKRATQIVGGDKAHQASQGRTSDTTRRTRWGRKRSSQPSIPLPPLPPEVPASSPPAKPRRPLSKSLDGLPLLDPEPLPVKPDDLDSALNADPLPLESERSSPVSAFTPEPVPGPRVGPDAGDVSAPEDDAVAVPAGKLVPAAMGDFESSATSAKQDSLDPPLDTGDEWLPELEFTEMVRAAPIRGRSKARAVGARGLGRRLAGVAGVVGLLVAGWFGLGLLGGGSDSDERVAAPEGANAPAESAGAPGAATPTSDTQQVLPATNTVTGGGLSVPRSVPVTASSETNYVAAYASARAQFDSVMAGVNFAAVFDTKRLQTESGLLTSLSMIRATMNAVQLYRSREMAIEAAHPNVEVSERERAEVVATVDSLLAAMDATYGLLVSQYGRYRLADGALLFSNPAAEQEYVDLTRRITRQGRILQRLNRERPTLTGERIAQGVVGPSLPRLGTVIEAPTLKKLPAVDVQIEGPQWDSIEAERRARLTDSIIKAGLERPPQAPTP